MERDTAALVDNTTYLHQNEVRSYESVEALPGNDSGPRKLPQYAAAISATLAALGAGIILGWTSPIKSEIENGEYNNISVNDNQMGWIGSLTNVGALLACIPTGFVCDIIGRKTTLLLLLLPFTLGWVLIIFAMNLAMLYSGRFIMGIAIGACCVAAPMYTSEVSHKDIRGSIGSYFQLMVTVGVLYAYSFGAFMTPLHYTIICASELFLFALTFAFQPESPLYYLKSSQYEKARMSLQKLRGSHYNVDEELNEMAQSLQEGEASVTLLHAFQRRACKKSVLISLSLMFFQQFSGINAIIFYTSDIFINAGVKLNPRYCSIIVGACQVVTTFASSLIVDKLGRRLLLITSALLMSISMILLATFFVIKDHKLVPDDTLKTFSFAPIIFLVLYIIAFSLGFGPIPWLLNGEIFAPEIKAVASSVAGSFNWFLAFIITKFYLQLDKSFGDDNMFYTFGFVLLFAASFVWLIVPETKGKTMAEIQDELQHY